MSHEDVELQRDCEAIRIPQGLALFLPKGTHAQITQALGREVRVRRLPLGP